MEILRSWVLNIVSIIIFITFLEILLPSSSIKKYIKMIVGLLVMVVILNPLLDLINGNVSIENEILSASSQLDQKSLSLNISQLEEKQKRQMMEYYKANIEANIKDRIEHDNETVVLSISSNIDEDINSKDFGSIKTLNVQLSDVMAKEVNEDEKVIPTVIISINSTREKNKSSPQSQGTSIDKIRSSISDLYSIDENNIFIEYK